MAYLERILIVGGGIAGLTLATALHQRGFTAEVVEQSPAWQAPGAGLAVQPNGMHVLRALGLGSAIEQAGTVIRCWAFYAQQGEVLCETNFEPAHFSSLAIPTLLLLGDESPDYLQAGTKVVHAAVPTSQLHIMPGQQHTAMRTIPELFTREVLTFRTQAD